MGKRFDYALEKEMDRAIMFLSQAFWESGHNEKPVILHSIRVGMTLFNAGFSRETVLGGLLHDILEDTGLPEVALRREFGDAVGNIVAAATFDPAIRSKEQQSEDMFLRCRACGFDALAVKCADILDNIDYFVPTPGYEELCLCLTQKYHLFLQIAESTLEKQEIYILLKAKIKHVDQLMKNFLKEKE